MLFSKLFHIERKEKPIPMMPISVLAIPLKHPFTTTSVAVKGINRLLMTLPIFRECMKLRMQKWYTMCVFVSQVRIFD